MYYVLRRYFGISAHEADNVIPDWEISSLLRQWNAANQGSA